MSEFPPATTAAHAPGAPNSISVPFVIGSVVLAMLGMLAVVLWLVTFQWIYFLGLIPMLLGALLWFHPRAGSDRSG
ncbi:MAG TPA: hypothetical protein VGV64_08470 [Thermoplasmata archaeon]|nr:hypothetical protein [Thermoplasmata archaeon]